MSPPICRNRLFELFRQKSAALKNPIFQTFHSKISSEAEHFFDLKVCAAFLKKIAEALCRQRFRCTLFHFENVCKKMSEPCFDKIRKDHEHVRFQNACTRTKEAWKPYAARLSDVSGRLPAHFPGQDCVRREAICHMPYAFLFICTLCLRLYI